MNITLDFYNENANDFVANTQKVDFRQTQDKFAVQIMIGGRILDFGCGSGRDTKYFMERGFCVDAVDGSEKICEIASAFIGSPVHKMLFQELDAVDLYDGIWACSSILHLPKTELKGVLGKMSKALKSDGMIYTSFKYGKFEGIRNGRYFTDFTEETFSDFLKDIPGIRLEELWITNDVRPDRGEEKWLNLILRKWDTV
jgi:SAM-dependent methyltransferase